MCPGRVHVVPPAVYVSSKADSDHTFIAHKLENTYTFQKLIGSELVKSLLVTDERKIFIIFP